jgi:hypothetical protein
MDRMKSFQQDYLNQSALPLKPVTTFPPYWGYGAAFGWGLNKVSSFGLFYNYNSTGGRLDYEDYSGTARFDQLLHCVSLGTFYQCKLNKSEKWPLHFSISVSKAYTNMAMTESLVVGGQSNSSQYSFYSTNYGFRPSLILRRQFGVAFIHTGIGYEVQLAGKVYLKDNNSLYLKNSSGDDVTAQWGGLRLTLGFGILLSKQNTSNE